MKEFIHHHKLLFILLAALLTTAVLTALVSLSLQTGKAQSIITLTEQNGVYDLTNIPDLEKTVVRIVPGSATTPIHIFRRMSDSAS